MQFQFATVLVFFALAVAFVGGMLLLGSLVRPNNPEPLKLSTYECGEPPTGSAWLNFNIRFYIVALIFLIFEVEIVFILPVALIYKDWVLRGDGLFAFVEILVFLAILLVGLVYVWAKGDFDWLKKVGAEEEPRDESMREAA
jgi:NADH-quinone oxidoreductase subunit A